MRSFLLSSVLAVGALLVAAPAAAQQPGDLTVVLPFPVPPLPVPVLVAPAPSPPPPAPGEYPVFDAPVAPPPMVVPPERRGKKTKGVSLAIDLGAAVPLTLPADAPHQVGYGIDVRVGYRFAVGPLFLSPEATVGWVDFRNWEGAIRAGVGGRVGVDAGLVEPSVYAYGGGFYNLWKTGPGVRAGAALDFRPGRWFAPGIHVDYNEAGWGTGSLSYVGAGAHMGFVL